MDGWMVGWFGDMVEWMEGLLDEWTGRLIDG